MCMTYFRAHKISVDMMQRVSCKSIGIIRAQYLENNKMSLVSFHSKASASLSSYGRNHVGLLSYTS